MKPHGKISGKALSAILEKLGRQLDDFYCELDELRYAISRSVKWLEDLHSEVSYLLDEFDLEQDVDPSIVEQVDELMEAVDSIPSALGELSDTLQALERVSKQFYEAKDDWDALMEEASFQEGVVESEG